jgi:indole-3-glycerol phosphate synthase
MSLIHDIVSASQKRLDLRKTAVPLDEVRGRAKEAPRATVGLREALEAKPFSLIAEIKPRSPSGGAMDAANVEEALGVYDSTPGVSAISILTDIDYFDSSPERLAQARPRTKKPLLRKDFIVDEYQVWEARACGADAILVMAALHAGNPARAVDLGDLAIELGMDVLFELGMHGEDESHVTLPRAAIWGINSRQFQTSKLRIDSSSHANLRALVPPGKLAVAESGVNEPSDLRRLVELGYRAALVGTAFLRKGAKAAEVVRGFDEEISRMIASGGSTQTSPSGLLEAQLSAGRAPR